MKGIAMLNHFKSATFIGCFALLLKAAIATEVPLVITSPGRTFEGLGALSAGASSRLLMDYPEAQRRELLDFLFKPNYGASLHHLKVEIGGDVNSTDGTEPSFARTREEFENPRPEYFQRGYEWWLMVEARKRNPKIYLDVLQWGAPGWIGDKEHPDADPASMDWDAIKKRNRLKFYTQDNANFIAAFIHGAKRYHGVDIDFCGIWNETQWDLPWTKLLRRTLDAQELQRVRIIAADHTGPRPWEPAKDILKDKELADAVYAIGAHYPGMTRKGETDATAYDSIPEAKQTGKPLWSSEEGPWRGDWAGASQLARIFNRNYIRGKITKTIIWSLITSYYENLPIPNSGPMKANTPWSGHYEIQPATWIIAHTTQFAQPGWQYLDSACGFLPDNTGSYVTLRSPDSRDVSVVIETMDAKASQPFTIRPQPGLKLGALNVWRTTTNNWFEQLPAVALKDGVYTIALEPNAIYSLTTTRGQRRAQAKPPAPKPFPVPYKDNFESGKPGRYPKYFSDQAGVFEIAKRSDGKGQALRQTVHRRGIDWNGHPNPEPYTMIGSARWSNYEVSCDALIEGKGYAAIFGRVAHGPQAALPPQSYWAKVSVDGQWELFMHTKSLGRGEIRFGPNEWHRLGLKFVGTNITFLVDGTAVCNVSDGSIRSGMAGLGGGLNGVMFDDFVIEPVPETAISELGLLNNLAKGKVVRASSSWDRGFEAELACDGDDGTRWNSGKGELAGAWLEVDFGAPTHFDTIAVRQFGARIASYKLSVPDGEAWRDIHTEAVERVEQWQHSFSPARASKLRLTVQKTYGTNADSSTPSISEWEVYNSTAKRQ